MQLACRLLKPVPLSMMPHDFVVVWGGFGCCSQVEWLQANQGKAQAIAEEGSNFLREVFTADQVLCYTARALQRFSQQLAYKPTPTGEFTMHVDQDCMC